MFLRPSGWSYETGATGGIGIAELAISGGTVVLNDPSGTQKDFWYGGLGAGIGVGARFGKHRVPPLLIKKTAVAGAGSIKAFPSGGKIYMTDAFKGSELAESDIKGGTLYFDAGFGLGVGIGGTMMILGMEALPMINSIVNPLAGFLGEDAIRNAPAVLVMAGVNLGPQAGAGIAALVGCLR
ncbi:hypothetical protein AB4Y96_05130 [Phyllobacterium sp. TAF24]|uniref:hypothetical protein n=1 Tax=Phyllobacterium sp. TAF24 TaxID=3233068 RepID=UPI003F9E30B8